MRDWKQEELDRLAPAEVPQDVFDDHMSASRFIGQIDARYMSLHCLAASFLLRLHEAQDANAALTIELEQAQCSNV